MVPGARLELARPKTIDPKSIASTNSATRANIGTVNQYFIKLNSIFSFHVDFTQIKKSFY
jgi:hypothetical protein